MKSIVRNGAGATEAAGVAGAAGAASVPAGAGDEIDGGSSSCATAVAANTPKLKPKRDHERRGKREGFIFKIGGM